MPGRPQCESSSTSPTLLLKYIAKERQWASRYQADDVIRYARGSRDAGIERGSYARVVAINPVQNLLTIEKQNGERQTYDLKRLHGVSVYREIEREFSVGDRIQFTASDKQLQVVNRDRDY